MARAQRRRSETGIYHSMVRGIDKRPIFDCDEDRRFFLKRLGKYREECRMDIYAYCLMHNHVHLLVKESDIPLGRFMAKLETSYALYYNKKYGRVGHLFQNRFKSEPVEDDGYLLTVFRYIHQNPYRSGLNPFSWTSYHEYESSEPGIVDTGYMFALFSHREYLLRYLQHKGLEEVEELDTEKKIPDSEVLQKINHVTGIQNCSHIKGLPLDTRARILKDLRQSGLLIRQIEQATGISRCSIDRACKRKASM